VDPHFLLLDCIQESVQDETIRLYLTVLLNANLDPGFKLEQMRRNRRRQPVRFKETLERQAKVPDLADATVLLSEVHKPETVRVSGLGNSCTKELLQLYSSNAKTCLFRVLQFINPLTTGYH